VVTYRPGTHGLSALGVADDEPRIICDGCGLVYRLRTDRPPPQWFLDGKAPRGWSKSYEYDHLVKNETRTDLCAKCRQVLR